MASAQEFWVIARAFAKTGFLAIWCVISKTDRGCLHNWTTGTYKDFILDTGILSVVQREPGQTIRAGDFSRWLEFNFVLIR